MGSGPLILLADPAHQVGVDARQEAAQCGAVERPVIVDSPGPGPLTPSCVSVAVDWQATHSPIATNDRAPASTAAKPTAKIAGSGCRTPRRARGSLTEASKVNRAGQVGVPLTEICAGVGEDDIDGCGPRLAGLCENSHRNPPTTPVTHATPHRSHHNKSAGHSPPHRLCRGPAAGTTTPTLFQRLLHRNLHSRSELRRSLESARREPGPDHLTKRSGPRRYATSSGIVRCGSPPGSATRPATALRTGSTPTARPSISSRRTGARRSCSIARQARSAGMGGIFGPGYPSHDDHVHVDIRAGRTWSAPSCGI